MSPFVRGSAALRPPFGRKRTSEHSQTKKILTRPKRTHKEIAAVSRDFVFSRRLASCARRANHRDGANRSNARSSVGNSRGGISRCKFRICRSKNGRRSRRLGVEIYPFPDPCQLRKESSLRRAPNSTAIQKKRSREETPRERNQQTNL